MTRVISLFLLLLLSVGSVHAAQSANHHSSYNLPGVSLSFTKTDAAQDQFSNALKVVLLMTVLSLAPALLISVTSFSRIVLVLAMLRHALGLQTTPPNPVLISLALFLTLISMNPVITEIYHQAYLPYMQKEINDQQALATAVKPLRQFMVAQTEESTMMMMLEVSKAKQPKSINDVQFTQLVPAFMLSELKTAFKMGFIIFLPFLLIDLLVSSALMAMGMIMVPPITISLPIKLLIFVLIDGWSLVVRSLLLSF